MMKYFLEIGEKPQYYGCMTYVYQSAFTNSQQLAENKASKFLLRKYPRDKYQYRVMKITYINNQKNDYDVDLDYIIGEVIK